MITCDEPNDEIAHTLRDGFSGSEAGFHDVEFEWRS